jgi:hypothetical protein
MGLRAFETGRDRFSAERMVRDYVRVYHGMLGEEGFPRTPSQRILYGGG